MVPIYHIWVDIYKSKYQVSIILVNDEIIIFSKLLYCIWGFPVGAVAKNHLLMQETQETWVWSLGQEDPRRRKWKPTLLFLPGEFHGWRSPTGCSPRGCKEWDMTGPLSTHEWCMCMCTLSFEIKTQCYSDIFLLRKNIP